MTEDAARQAGVSRWRPSRSRWRGRALVLSFAGGGLASSALKHLGAWGHAEQVRPLALVFLCAAVSLALCKIAHRQMGYCQQYPAHGSQRRRRDAFRLARAVSYEGWLAAYFFVAWIIEYSWPGEDLEFLFGAIGYSAFLVVCGRVHRLAAGLDKPSISAAILGSQSVQEIKRDLQVWMRGHRPGSAPPLVKEASTVLALVPRVGEASVAMSVLATFIASVAFANAGPALESAGTALQPLVGITSKHSAAQGAKPSKESGGAANQLRTSATIPERPVSENRLPNSPTYETLCGRSQEPGRGAPEPIARRLFDLWLGAEGVGGLIGGCARAAHPVRPGSGIWYAPGYRAATLVSLGVANADGTSALLLGQPARFAMSQASNATLESASERIRVYSGDLETVDTANGTYVFVRREINTRAHDAAYTVVPPGLVAAWFAADQAGGWVWPVFDYARDHLRYFSFVTPVGEEVGLASCANDLSCTSEIRGVTPGPSASDHLTVEQLTTAAPEAAG